MSERYPDRSNGASRSRLYSRRYMPATGTLVQRCATPLIPRYVSGGACWLHSTILLAGATCWGCVAGTRYIYGMGREWPWTLGLCLREVRTGQSGENALILRRNRPMKGISTRRRWGVMRRGGIRLCLNPKGGRGRLRERMLEQRAEAMTVPWAERRGDGAAHGAGRTWPRDDLGQESVAGRVERETRSARCSTRTSTARLWPERWRLGAGFRVGRRNRTERRRDLLVLLPAWPSARPGRHGISSLLA